MNYTCTLMLRFFWPPCQHWHSEFTSCLIHDFMFFVQVSLFLKDRPSPTAVDGHFVPVWVEPGYYPKNWL